MEQKMKKPISKSLIKRLHIIYSAQGIDDEQKRAILKRVQRIGIDTTDWGAVNAFCLDVRIAGKKFRELDGEELLLLIPKLESILKKKEDGGY